MSWLESLSQRFAEMYGAQGIDWTLFDEQGLLLSDPRYSYRDEVLRRITPVYDVIGTLRPSLRDRYRALRRAEGQKALTELWRSIQASGGEIWGAVASETQATLTMSQEGFEDAMLTLAAYIADGAALHLSLVMEDALTAGSVTVSEVRQHADGIVKMASALVLVNEEGGLDDLKVERPVAGLGFAWLAALPAGAWWAISVVGIAAVLGVAYLLHGVFVTLPIQEKTLDTCEKLAAKGLIDSAQQCFDQMENPDLSAPWAAPLKTLSYVAIGGAALYAFSLALPHLMRARREARA